MIEVSPLVSEVGFGLAVAESFVLVQTLLLSQPNGVVEVEL